MFRRRGKTCVASFDSDEVRVLRRVLGEVIALVADGFDPDDPVVQRLFPDAYPDSSDDAAEYRRYTEDDLKTGKIDQAGTVLAALPSAGGTEVRLDPEEAEAWLRALTDARLALGIRLEIRDETDLEAELDEAVLKDPSSQRVFQLSVYAYLGYLQESLVGALTAIV